MAETWSRCPGCPNGMGLGDPTPQMGRNNTQGTCGGINGRPARFTLSPQESSDTTKLLQQEREWQHFHGLWLELIINLTSTSQKPNSQLDSQHSHVHLKDFHCLSLWLLFTVQLWYTRAYSTSLAVVLVRNITCHLPELPCVVDE